MSTLKYNLILDADSYKMTHKGMCPTNEVGGIYAYIEARRGHSGNTKVVPFGLQMWIEKTLTTPITKEDIDEAEAFVKSHFMGNVEFDRAPWERIVNEYGGLLPITILSVPEGTVMPVSVPIFATFVYDRDFWFLVPWLETSLQRGVWYPTTVASEDRQRYSIIRAAFERAGADVSGVPFQLHDFGGRGVTCEEQAQIGGAAHLVYFKGSDTISGIRAANKFYNSEMSAFSVAASEHNVQIIWGPDRQKEYVDAIIQKFGKEGAIVSIVIDGYDTMREAVMICSNYAETAKAKGFKIVLRPDSGDPLVLIPQLLDLLAATFGFETRNGYRVLKNSAVLWGDGIDTFMIETILNKTMSSGYCPSNVVFGSGGALLQKVNRDTYSFAMKCSAYVKIDQAGADWVHIAKNPVTDPGKKSKSGLVTAVIERMTGQIQTGSVYSNSSDWQQIMVTVYDHGVSKNLWSLEEVRNRALKEFQK